MKIAIPKEQRAHESRVAASPETVKKLVALGFEVMVEKGAGELSAMPNAAYQNAGASLGKTAEETYKNADIILKIQRPFLKEEGQDELSLMKKGAILIGILGALTAPDHLKAYEAQGITAIALEMIPRITRAQSMDVLSSQSNLAGYRAVIEAAHAFGRAFPMMMTAAGTILPAKVLILGAGVAGLQAIATAKRLGAAVSAFDVRLAAKEQVESLGATFIAVQETQDTETIGGYAKEASQEYQKRQSLLIHEVLKTTDIAITTALIPGRPAPRLITSEMVEDMKPGSVIVDLAVENGGNCSLSELGRIVDFHGKKIIGYANLPGRIATDASALYARNLLNFLQLIWNAEQKKINLNLEDDTLRAAVVVHEGVRRLS